MADGNFDDFEIDKDLDFDPDLEAPPKRGGKRAPVKAAPSARDLAADLALTLPTDRDALLRIAADALVAYDAAIVRDTPAAAEDARRLYDATIFRLNGDTWFASFVSNDAPGYVVARHTATPPGEAPRWNQQGVQRVEADGVVAALACKGGFDLGGQYSWHALELDKPFFSSTGYLSYLGPPIIWGATMQEAAVVWMRAVIRGERKLSIMPPDSFIRTRPLEYGHLIQAPVASAPSGLMSFPF